MASTIKTCSIFLCMICFIVNFSGWRVSKVGSVQRNAIRVGTNISAYSSLVSDPKIMPPMTFAEREIFSCPALLLFHSAGQVNRISPNARYSISCPVPFSASSLLASNDRESRAAFGVFPCDGDHLHFFE